MALSIFNYPSPLGILNIKFNKRGIISISFVKDEKDNIKNIIKESDRIMYKGIYKEIYKELNDYFTGQLKSFEIPIILDGTDFQKKVWRELLKIPYGKKKTYGEIARAIGSPGAARAVGNANNKNKIPIIVPCHRVLGADGSLTGYAGGLEKKQWLLKHEKKYKRSGNHG